MTQDSEVGVEEVPNSHTSSNSVSVIHSSDGKERVKALRRACENCTKSKIKCSGDEVCKQCDRRGSKCVYLHQLKRGPRKLRSEKNIEVNRKNKDFVRMESFTRDAKRRALGRKCFSDVEIRNEFYTAPVPSFNLANVGHPFDTNLNQNQNVKPEFSLESENVYYETRRDSTSTAGSLASSVTAVSDQESHGFVSMEASTKLRVNHAQIQRSFYSNLNRTMSAPLPAPEPNVFDDCSVYEAPVEAQTPFCVHVGNFGVGAPNWSSDRPQGFAETFVSFPYYSVAPTVQVSMPSCDALDWFIADEQQNQVRNGFSYAQAPELVDNRHFDSDFRELKQPMFANGHHYSYSSHF